MDEYWKHLYDSLSKSPDTSLLEQVGKTLNGAPLPEEQLTLIVDSAVEALNLSKQDLFVDLCCGNGIITERIAPLVRRAWGIDQSAGLIAAAQRHSNAENVEYIVAEAIHVDPHLFSGLRKYLINESIQHFTTEYLDNVLHAMSRLESGSMIYLSGIPDLEKIKLYYDTPAKIAFYESREREGKPHSGKWWLRSDIEQIARNRGFRTRIVPQKYEMVTHYYRFDILLDK